MTRPRPAPTGPDFYLLDELLTDAEREVRDRVRAFADAEVLPIVNDYWDRGEFPFELVPKIAELRVARGVVTGHGCPGLSTLAEGLVAAELARADGGVRVFFHVHNLAMTTIALLGDDRQRARWLPGMARMEQLGAFAMTEPEHGSDVSGLDTRARRDGDGWVLEGTKRWIGSGTFADVVVVWARDDDGDVGAFVVEPPAPGWDARPITGKTACRTAVHAEIRLDGVRLPAEGRLSGARTFRDAGVLLARSRPAIAWEALGHAVAAYEIALAHTLERSQFGRPLAGFQLVQDKLARMLVELTTVQLMCWRLSRVDAEGRATAGMAAAAKQYAAATARRVVADARDLLGGDGVLAERHVARHQADVEAVFTYEGTDHVNTLIVGREITGLSAFAR